MLTLNSSMLRILKIIFLAISLTIAPFLRAEGTLDSSVPSIYYTSIYVFSDYSGALYIDREKTGELHALADDPLKIITGALGSHLLQQRIPDGEIINCYVSIKIQQDVFVYLHLGHSKIEYSSADKNYESETPSKTWIYFVVAGGILLLGGIVYFLSGFRGNGSGSVGI